MKYQWFDSVEHSTLLARVHHYDPRTRALWLFHMFLDSHDIEDAVVVDDFLQAFLQIFNITPRYTALTQVPGKSTGSFEKGTR